jgi:hypothetical protein
VCASRNTVQQGSLGNSRMVFFRHPISVRGHLHFKTDKIRRFRLGIGRTRLFLHVSHVSVSKENLCEISSSLSLMINADDFAVACDDYNVIML